MKRNAFQTGTHGTIQHFVKSTVNNAPMPVSNQVGGWVVGLKTTWSLCTTAGAVAFWAGGPKSHIRYAPVRSQCLDEDLGFIFAFSLPPAIFRLPLRHFPEGRKLKARACSQLLVVAVHLVTLSFFRTQTQANFSICTET